MRHPILRRCTALAIAGVATLVVSHGRLDGQEGFRFRTGVELVNVTATVTDQSGRFVSNLGQSDFLVYEDERPVEITHFSAERVPVSLGIILDTSGSMRGQKIAAARAALDRFLFDLLGPEDEIFLYRFDTVPHLVQGWTTDRTRISSELRKIQPDGSTALYDAVAEALPLLKSGHHRKKALLVISDGIDTTSHTDLPTLKRLIHESEALVYAIGMGVQTTVTPLGGSADGFNMRLQRRRPTPPIRLPFPFPGGRTPPRIPPIPGVPPGTRVPWPPETPPGDRGRRPGSEETISVTALREITDDSGGRTEIVRDPRDLTTATTSLADELSKQYSLGYLSAGHRDGRWHTIRVEVRGQSLRVRARRGYIAAS